MEALTTCGNYNSIKHKILCLKVYIAKDTYMWFLIQIIYTYDFKICYKSIFVCMYVPQLIIRPPAKCALGVSIVNHRL